MKTNTSGQQDTLYRWLWRWHGYAGLFVIPFIFWMALTGLPYVWEREIEDGFHPEFRALAPQATRVSYEEQLSVARVAAGDQPLLKVITDASPAHATQFMFGTEGDPVSVFINPYDGGVITTMREWTRLVFATKSLHGLTFIEPYGSWLLELLACWGIVLCITGVYLWRPRTRGWSVWGVFLPRLHSDGRTRWRDLHAVTGFYFAVVLALYLLTGLPWTAFWGGKYLGAAQAAAGQDFPMTMTAFSGLQSSPPSPASKPLSLDEFVRFGMEQHLPGHLVIEMPATPTGTVHVRNRLKQSMREVHYQLDLFTGKPVATTQWSDLPGSQKIVALGINLHEGQLFGRVTQILSTVLACVFMLMAGAAMTMWWKRRPQGRLDWPRLVPRITLPLGVKVATAVIGLVLPLAGLTFVAIAFLLVRRGTVNGV